VELILKAWMGVGGFFLARRF